jgi:hypothetical protein
MIGDWYGFVFFFSFLFFPSALFCNIIYIFSDFFIYNNYKNNIINNKSDKNKILNLRIAARHCQWCLYWNVSLSVTSLLKRATGSDAFVSFKWQSIPAHVFIVIKNSFLGKRATINGVFTQRCHCQWRVCSATLPVARCHS